MARIGFRLGSVGTFSRDSPTQYLSTGALLSMQSSGAAFRQSSGAATWYSVVLFDGLRELEKIAVRIADVERDQG